jgi:hypothetical protein
MTRRQKPSDVKTAKDKAKIRPENEPRPGYTTVPPGEGQSQRKMIAPDERQNAHRPA